LIGNLTLRSPEVKNAEFEDNLVKLRAQIDQIDDQIIQTMAERMKLVEKIGEYKRDNGVTIFQLSRWDEIIHKRSDFAKALNLEMSFVGKLLELIHGESIRKQTEIMNEGVPPEPKS